MIHPFKLTLLFLVVLLGIGGAALAQRVAIEKGDNAGNEHNRAAPRDEPRLTISKTHSGNFVQGQRGATYSVTVSNTGDDETRGAVTVTDTTPAGLTLVAMAGDGWVCTPNRCLRSDPLEAGSSYPPIVVTVDVAADAGSPQVNTVAVKWRGSTRATATDSTIVVPAAPVLSITKSHTGNFTQGQQGATYSVTVSNAANAGPTSGAVTMTETVPDGLTLVSMAGTGWQCASTTCTRSDALAPGTSYPVITVLVDVAANATSPQVNAVAVTGGGSAGASATDPTTVVPQPTWTSIGPEGGAVLAVAIDPLTPTTLYAGTRGGLFKSTDGGKTWSALAGPHTRVDALVIDPLTPTTLYAATYYDRDRAVSVAEHPAIFKSADGGASWSVVLQQGLVSAFVIDPLTPTTLYAGIYGIGQGNGVFKSADGGATWSTANSGLDTFGPYFPVRALAIDPVTPTTLYVGLAEANPAGNFLKSTNGGGSWTDLNVAFPDRLPPYTVTTLAIDPLTPTTLYAATTARGRFGGLFKSLDGGASWRGISGLGPETFFLDLAIDPLTATTLYAETAQQVRPPGCIGLFCPVGVIYGVYKSADGGGSWQAADSGLPPGPSDLAIDPLTPTTLYAGTSRGVYRSTDGGGSWSATSIIGLTNTSVTALAIDSLTPTTLYAGTDGVFKSADGGGSWSAANGDLPANTIVSTLAIDPLTSTTLYAGTAQERFECCPQAGTIHGVYKSADGAASWSAANSGLPTNTRAAALAIHPLTPTTLYVGMDSVYKTTDSGGNWSAANSGLPIDTPITALAIDPLTPTTLYAGAGRTTNTGLFRGVYKSTDGGESWSAANSGLPADRPVTVLAIDPLTPTTLYAGTDGAGVFKSADGGGSWSSLNIGLTNASVTALAIDPVTPTTLYAGTDGAGVFISADGGGSWNAINGGLTNTRVTVLAIDPLTSTTLYAGTNGGGVFVRH